MAIILLFGPNTIIPMLLDIDVHVTKVSIVLFNNFIEIESEWHKISRKVYGLNTNVKPTNIRRIA